MMASMINPDTPHLTLYGIPNCGTVKKARAWLTAHGATYQFHDFKKYGAPADRLAQWMGDAGWEKLLNRQGTTWRKLDAAEQSSADTPQGAHSLALTHPSLIKRPVVQWPHGAVTVGFDASGWAELATK